MLIFSIGLWQECRGSRIFEGTSSFSSCKSTGSDNFVGVFFSSIFSFPSSLIDKIFQLDLTNHLFFISPVQLAECLALICGLVTSVVWILYMCQSSRAKTRSKNLKYATVVIVTMAGNIPTTI